MNCGIPADFIKTLRTIVEEANKNDYDLLLSEKSFKPLDLSYTKNFKISSAFLETASFDENFIRIVGFRICWRDIAYYFKSRSKEAEAVYHTEIKPLRGKLEAILKPVVVSRLKVSGKNLDWDLLSCLNHLNKIATSPIYPDVGFYATDIYGWKINLMGLNNGFRYATDIGDRLLIVDTPDAAKPVLIKNIVSIMPDKPLLSLANFEIALIYRLNDFLSKQKRFNKVNANVLI